MNDANTVKIMKRTSYNSITGSHNQYSHDTSHKTSREPIYNTVIVSHMSIHVRKKSSPLSEQ